MDNTIQRMLIALPDSKLKLVLSLRDILLGHQLTLKEKVKYGRISYVDLQQRDIAFICINAKHSYIELGFFEGVYLDNSLGLLHGKNKLIRRLTIHELTDTLSAQIYDWILALNKD